MGAGAQIEEDSILKNRFLFAAALLIATSGLAAADSGCEPVYRPSSKGARMLGALMKAAEPEAKAFIEPTGQWKRTADEEGDHDPAIPSGNKNDKPAHIFPRDPQRPLPDFSDEPSARAKKITETLRDESCHEDWGALASVVCH